MKQNDSTVEAVEPRGDNLLDIVELVIDMINYPFLWALYHIAILFIPVGALIRIQLLRLLCGRIDTESAEAVLVKAYRSEGAWLDNGILRFVEDELVAQIEDNGGFEEEEEAIHHPLDPEFVEETAQTIALDKLDIPTPASSWKQRDASSIALEAILEFINYLFDEEGAINEQGVIFGTTTPWATRGDIPGPAKQKAIEIIEVTSPPVFFRNISNLWQLNLPDYPSKQAAIETVVAASKGV